jgi:hypothetical protein
MNVENCVLLALHIARTKSPRAAGSTQRLTPAATPCASAVSSESFDVKRTAVPTADLQRVEQRKKKKTGLWF